MPRVRELRSTTRPPHIKYRRQDEWRTPHTEGAGAEIGLRSTEAPDMEPVQVDALRVPATEIASTKPAALADLRPVELTPGLVGSDDDIDYA